MSGGAYPRKKDYTDEKAFYEDYAKEYAKYALRASANPWVLFLEKSGFYDRMKKEIDRLRDEYEKMKKDAGIVEVKRDRINPRVINALSTKKSKQLGKFNAAKHILEQIASDEPNPIREEFARLLEKEYEKAEKMGFSQDDTNKVFERVFGKLTRAIESAQKDLERYKAPPTPIQPVQPAQPEVEVAKGYPRPSYKVLAKQLARKYGFRLPRSARKHGKTWKEIYMDLTTGLK
jgi:GTPase SAR1 family protein